MPLTRKNRVIQRGLYLSFWPNGSFSVVHYKTPARISDLFRDLDAFGNPHDAKVVFFRDEVAIDFELDERRGRPVITKSVTDRGRTKWIRFPRDIVETHLSLGSRSQHGR